MILSALLLTKYTSEKSHNKHITGIQLILFIQNNRFDSELLSSQNIENMSTNNYELCTVFFKICHHVFIDALDGSSKYKNSFGNFMRRFFVRMNCISVEFWRFPEHFKAVERSKDWKMPVPMWRGYYVCYNCNKTFEATNKTSWQLRNCYRCGSVNGPSQEVGLIN